jgi:hypothetical protein
VLANVLGEKRARVAIEKKREYRLICEQLCQFINRDAQNVSALAYGSRSEPLAWLKESQFAGVWLVPIIATGPVFLFATISTVPISDEVVSET